MDAANNNNLPEIPPFPLFMFVFACFMGGIDGLCDLLMVLFGLLIPIIGSIFGILADAASDTIFYGFFLGWKVMTGMSGSHKLSVGNYMLRALIGWIAGQIPFINLFDKPVAVWSTWHSEKKKALQARDAAIHNLNAAQNYAQGSGRYVQPFIDITV